MIMRNLTVWSRGKGDCAEAHAGSPTEASYKALLEARRNLTSHIKGLTSSEITRNAHTVFAEGDKNGKLLAMLVADHHPIAHIPAIKDKGEHWSLTHYAGVYWLLFNPILAHPKIHSSIRLAASKITYPETEEDCNALEAKITIKEV